MSFTQLELAVLSHNGRVLPPQKCSFGGWTLESRLERIVSQDNEPCSGGVQLYSDRLDDARTVDTVTIERGVETIALETDARRVRQLEARYLGWTKLTSYKTDGS